MSKKKAQSSERMSTEKNKVRSASGSNPWKDVQQVSSLSLQILLFFNVYLAAVWMPVLGNYVYEMMEHFGAIHKVLTILGCVISMPGEILRLHLGYSGNLRGRISDMAGFWILTTLVQLPIQLYLALTVDSEWHLIAYLEYIFVCLLSLQAITGAYASNILSEHHSQQYRIQLISKMHQNS